MQETDETGTKYSVPNLERALSILELLAAHPGGLKLAEITQRLGYPKNSVFRVTTTLCDRGYLTRDEATKCFRLSRKLLAMGHQVLSERPIVPAAIDVMYECRDALKETVLLGTIVEDGCIVLEQVLGTHPFKFSIDMGARINLHASAPGKAMLAYLPEAEREGLVSRLKLTRFNERTITSKKALATELQYVRECGFALDRGEELHGIVCVAGPVLNQHGYPVASMWITGPADRVPEDLFAQTGTQIRRYADTISARLGYHPAP